MKNMTWKELWLKQIHKSCSLLSDTGQIEIKKRHPLEIQILRDILSDTIKNLIQELINLNLQNNESHFNKNVGDKQDQQRMKNFILVNEKCETENMKIDKFKCINKSGSIKDIKQDKESTNNIINKLRKFSSKDNCFDIFQNTKVNDIRMYPEKPMVNVIKYKFQKVNKEM